MSSFGDFLLEVKVPEDGDAQQRANDILQLMREEIGDPNEFLPDLEEICIRVSNFLDCELEFSNNGGKLKAKFIFS